MSGSVDCERPNERVLLEDALEPASTVVRKLEVGLLHLYSELVFTPLGPPPLLSSPHSRLAGPRPLEPVRVPGRSRPSSRIVPGG